jgi:hypothetical protein
MRVLRASEIGSYLFCQRAWWYRLQGKDPRNLGDLASGHELHRRHGRVVLKSGLLRSLAFLLLLSALVLLAIYFVNLIL